MTGFKISEVAEKSNVNIETVRYYEKRQLIPEPPRTRAGYRIFSLEDVDRIKFIKRSQELGFTLNEIKQLISIQCSGSGSSDGRYPIITSLTGGDSHE